MLPRFRENFRSGKGGGCKWLPDLFRNMPIQPNLIRRMQRLSISSKISNKTICRIHFLMYSKLRLYNETLNSWVLNYNSSVKSTMLSQPTITPDPTHPLPLAPTRPPWPLFHLYHNVNCRITFSVYMFLFFVYTSSSDTSFKPIPLCWPITTV